MSSRQEKVAEPSMEDILASIRKIIAEEPIGTRTIPAAPSASMASTAQPATRQASPAVKPQAPAPAKATAASLDDVLSMADDVPTSRQAAPAPKPPVEPARREAPQPFFPPPAGASLSASLSAQAGLPVPAPATSLSARDEQKAPVAEPLAAAPVVPPARPAAQMTAQSPLARTPVGFGTELPPKPSSAPAPVQEQPELKSVDAKPIDTKAVDTKPVDMKPVEAKTIDTKVSEAPAPKVMAAPSMPVTASASPMDAARTTVAPWPVDTAPPSPTPHAIKKSEAILAGLTPPSTPPAAPMSTPLPSTAAPSAPAVPASAPVILTAPLPAPTPVAQKEKAPIPAAAAMTGQLMPMSSIEERVVDLLRPMVREWLDTNMPRMLERALTVELASSSKSKINGAAKN